MNKNQHIVLIGMPASGKSTVGEVVARVMGRKFYDSDALIEKAMHQSISDIFYYRGEAYFRHKEAVTVASLIHLKPGVIATGGGAVLDKHTHKLLQSQCVVYLDTPFERLWQRLEHDTTRPHFDTDDKYEVLQKHYKARQPVYAQLATLRINTENKMPTEIAAEILSALNIDYTLKSGTLCIESTL